MLDINLIRENEKTVRQALLKRMDKVDFTELLEWDTMRRENIFKSEKLKSEKNIVSGEIPILKKNGQDIFNLLAQMKSLSEQIKSMDSVITDLDGKIKNFLSSLPNIPADDVVAGGKENNEVISTWGEKPKFDFEPKNHVDIVTSLNIIDYERGVKLGGNGFWLYRNEGTILEWALLNYFIEEHRKDGYEFLLVPHILNYECGYTAGQFPKFYDDVFHIEDTSNEANKQFILPTAETALASLHRNEILKEEDLPKKYFSYTPCYRREAGSYRANERGMIRGHQFNKIEMFQYTLPEHSDKALEELIGKAESLVKGLGLHYRLSKLAAKDCSASMGKTYDIEIWLPSMNEYKEISSASNAYDYQARRGNMRFKRESTKKNEFMHTLNASGLATSRLFPAIMEQFQQADGSVIIPEVLVKWTGFNKIEMKK